MTLALLLTAVTGAWAQSTLNVVELEVPAEWATDESPVTAADLPGFKAVNLEEAQTWTGAPAEGNAMLFYAFDGDKINVVNYSNGKEGSNGKAELTKKLVFGIKSNVKFYYTAEPAAPAAEPAIDVTINDAKSEASFQMPQYDVTATYTIKRDISVDVTATMGDGTDGVRYRVKKSEQVPGKYEPAEMNMMQVLALVAVNDGIEQKDLTLNQDYYCRIYKLDEQTQQPEGDGVLLADFDFAPGLYALKAFAEKGSNYAGETALSNTFKLFQGYEVTVGAGEYATFYKDENLYTEDEDAELYTIASVTDTEAVLSEAITVAPAETPLLVYNKSEESKTFLLIPTTDDADEVTPAKEFKGSLTEGEIPASSAVTDYYALNGKAFVWVKYAIEIGANKCWLQIGDQPAAARAMTRSITGGGNTTNMDDVRWQMEDGNYYDLQGRKVEKPNRKGIYIHNGKKVVVRK